MLRKDFWIVGLETFKSFKNKFYYNSINSISQFLWSLKEC